MLIWELGVSRSSPKLPMKDRWNFGASELVCGKSKPKAKITTTCYRIN